MRDFLKPISWWLISYFIYIYIYDNYNNNNIALISLPRSAKPKMILKFYTQSIYLYICLHINMNSFSQKKEQKYVSSVYYKVMMMIVKFVICPTVWERPDVDCSTVFLAQQLFFPFVSPPFFPWRPLSHVWLKRCFSLLLLLSHWL